VQRVQRCSAGCTQAQLALWPVCWTLPPLPELVPASSDVAMVQLLAGLGAAVDVGLHRFPPMCVQGSASCGQDVCRSGINQPPHEQRGGFTQLWC
jgi:hypothetical protein